MRSEGRFFGLMSKAVLVLLLCLGTSAQAQGSRDKICQGLGGTAATIMRTRQDDMALSQVMQVINDSDMNETYLSIVRALVLEAYDRPRFTVPENQAEAVEDFRNDVELWYYTAD